MAAGSAEVGRHQPRGRSRRSLPEDGRDHRILAKVWVAPDRDVDSELDDLAAGTADFEGHLDGAPLRRLHVGARPPRRDVVEVGVRVVLDQLFGV